MTYRTSRSITTAPTTLCGIGFDDLSENVAVDKFADGKRLGEAREVLEPLALAR